MAVDVVGVSGGGRERGGREVVEEEERPTAVLEEVPVVSADARGVS